MGGELFDMVIERKHFTEADAASITAAVLSVMQHCHSKGIIHRGALGCGGVGELAVVSSRRSSRISRPRTSCCCCGRAS